MAIVLKRTESASATPVKRLVLPMVLVMLALALLLLGVTVYSGRTMDRDAIARQQALIDNAFTTRLNRAVGELRSVAWWASRGSSPQAPASTTRAARRAARAPAALR